MLIDTVISSYVKITLTNEKRVLFVSLIEKKKKKRKKREIENNSVNFSLYTHTYQILVIQSLVDAITIRYHSIHWLKRNEIRMSVPVYVFHKTTKGTSFFLDTLLLFSTLFPHRPPPSPLSPPFRARTLSFSN